MLRNIRTQSDYKSTLVRNQLTSLVLYETIKTTDSKARALLAFANRFFLRVLAKDVNAFRYAQSVLLDSNAVKKTFEEILPRYKETDKTYVRSFKVTSRRGDNANQVMVSLVKPLTIEEKPKPEKQEPKKLTRKELTSNTDES